MTPEKRQIDIQTETLFKDAVAQYFEDGLDLRKYPHLESDMRILCRLLAVMSVKQAGMMVNSLEQVFKELEELKESAAPTDNSQLEQALEQASKERKQLAKMLIRLQKSGGSSATASPPSWKEYVKSPLGIMSIVIAVLMLLNLIF